MLFSYSSFFINPITDEVPMRSASDVGCNRFSWWVGWNHDWIDHTWTPNRKCAPIIRHLSPENLAFIFPQLTLNTFMPWPKSWMHVGVGGNKKLMRPGSFHCFLLHACKISPFRFLHAHVKLGPIRPPKLNGLDALQLQNGWTIFIFWSLD